MERVTSNGEQVACSWKHWKSDTVQSILAIGVHLFIRHFLLCLVKHFFEHYVGKALSETTVPREDLFVQTKFVTQEHHKPFTLPYPRYEEPYPFEACVLSYFRSLENLKTDYIDAFLVHAPELTADSMVPLLQTVMKLKQRGRIRYTGISNVPTVQILKFLNEQVPGVVQIVQNPLHVAWDPEYKISQYCREHGIQYNTFHTLTTSDRFLESALLQQIAKQRRSTPQQIFLQFCIEIGITPLIGARSVANLTSCLRLANGAFGALSFDQKRGIVKFLAEQAIINRQRSAFILEKRSRELRTERKLEKREELQQLRAEIAEETAEEDAQEQELINAAKMKARAKAFAQRLYAEAGFQHATEDEQEHSTGGDTRLIGEEEE